MRGDSYTSESRQSTRVIPWSLSAMFVVMALMGIYTIMSGMGAFAVMGTLSDVASDGKVEPSTLDDYSPVQDLTVQNGTLTVTLEENPHFEAAGSFGRLEITHLQLSRADGKVGGVRNVTIGQLQYRYKLPREIQGNYTLALQHREPPEPGLFGHSGRTDSQVVEFQITADGEINVTEVPYASRYK